MVCNLKVVLVYLGEHIPDYVFDNLSFLKYHFPNQDIVLIGDSTEALSKAVSLGIPTLNVSKSNIYDLALRSQKTDDNFRSGFWHKTLLRLYVLEHLMVKEPDQPILHIESDIWISPHFPFEKFMTLHSRIAFPISSRGNGLASTIFFKDLSALKFLLDFIDGELASKEAVTDVSALGAFQILNPNGLSILPTITPWSDSYFSWVDEDTQILMSNDISYWGGVFDASTHGIFLTGEDPRNAWGFRKLFTNLGDHAINARTLNYTYLDGGVHIECQGASVPLFSLHIHSKDRRMFNATDYSSRLKYLCYLPKNQARREFLGFLTIRVFVSTIVYQMRFQAHRILRVVKGSVRNA